MMSTIFADDTRMSSRKKSADESRDRIDLRVDPALVARANRQATRLGISLSAYIRQALTLKVEQDEAAEPVPRRLGRNQ
jgi:predicted HicB family RNase H-like nuclease